MELHGHCSGGRNTPEYISYNSMVTRCTNPKHSKYDYYGGAGVTICDRWLEPSGKGFLNFLEDMGERPDGLTLDRIDGALGYYKGNCRWSSRTIQMYNQEKKKPRNATSKYRGVSFFKNRVMKWCARICIGGKTIWGGCYSTQEEAALAYNDLAVKTYGTDAKLNIVEAGDGMDKL